MRRAGIGEWVLKRAAGAGRGTAMYGDLVELAATRGGAWFWLVYARTVIALTWRPLVGCVVALAVLVVVDSLAFGNEWQRFVFFHFPHRWRRVPRGHEALLLYNFLYRALSAASSTTCLLASYSAVRYGIRDKPVRASLAVGAMLTSAMAMATEWPMAVALITLASQLRPQGGASRFPNGVAPSPARRGL